MRGTAAQGRLQASRARIQNAAAAVEAAKQDAAAATALLRRLEAEIEAAQGPDSEFAKAHMDLKDAQKAYDAARARVYKSPEYLAKYKRALGSPDKAKLLPQVRREAEGSDPEYEKAKSRLNKVA